MQILGRNPTLWLGVIYALLTTVGTLGLAHFTGTEAALTNAFIAAIVGCVNAYTVRPVSPVAFTYAIACLVSLLAAYGVVIPDATLAAVNALVVPILALVSRNQVSPIPTALTKGSNSDNPTTASKPYLLARRGAG